jgi:hypothetical protein
VPRILLPLLLCLSLIAGAIGSVWSATAMAMPAAAAAVAEAVGMDRGADHACCHDGGGMHDSDRQPQPPAASCDDGKHCDCTQHCNMLPTPLASPAGAIARSAEPTDPTPGRYDVRPRQLHRPPIA